MQTDVRVEKIDVGEIVLQWVVRSKESLRLQFGQNWSKSFTGITVLPPSVSSKKVSFFLIVCVVVFFHLKKNSQWWKIWNLLPTKDIANEDDPQIQKQEQPVNSQQEPAVKLCWPKTMKESSIINRGSCIMIQICHDWLSNNWNHQIKKCQCWPFFLTHFCKSNCIK